MLSCGDQAHRTQLERIGGGSLRVRFPGLCSSAVITTDTTVAFTFHSFFSSSLSITILPVGIWKSCWISARSFSTTFGGVFHFELVTSNPLPAWLYLTCYGRSLLFLLIIRKCPLSEVFTEQVITKRIENK
ncbi:unnamed protein product [Pleuronectes platessa]|uniref:Uncharacterized protein n=1 Tax=Pleuronectes platessa TaxID=8262 RepID=A0A9N7YQW8_PLEPL|nr:unnamed protein product [Pleuronectes platessa]